MNKTIKFFGYFLMLFVLFMSSSFLLESCKGKSNDDVVYEDSDDEYSSDDEIYDEYFESDEEASRAGVEVDNVGDSEVDPEFQATEQDVTDYVEDFNYEATNEEKKAINTNSVNEQPRKSTSQTQTSSSSSKTTASSGGSFLVVAGSYLIKDNAQKMVDKLKNLGYPNAEIINFDESKYHSITAGRYSSRSQASQVAAALKNKGVDCYVHTRK